MTVEKARAFVLGAVDDQGRRTVTLDGQDISEEVRAVEVLARVGEPDQVILHLDRTHADSAVRTVGHVVALDNDPRHSAAAWLAGIHAPALHEAVLLRPDLPTGEHGLVQAMLDQLIEWAEEPPEEGEGA